MNRRFSYWLSFAFRMIISFRDNLSKQLELTNVKLKTESLNLNLLQEQCAELEKEKNIMLIEVEALHTDFNGRLGLLDSEITTVSCLTMIDRVALFLLEF